MWPLPLAPPTLTRGSELVTCMYIPVSLQHGLEDGIVAPLGGPHESRPPVVVRNVLHAGEGKERRHAIHVVLLRLQQREGERSEDTSNPSSE